MKFPRCNTFLYSPPLAFFLSCVVRRLGEATPVIIMNHARSHTFFLCLQQSALPRTENSLWKTPPVVFCSGTHLYKFLGVKIGVEFYHLTSMIYSNIPTVMGTCCLMWNNSLVLLWSFPLLLFHPASTGWARSGPEGPQWVLDRDERVDKVVSENNLQMRIGGQLKILLRALLTEKTF